MKTIGTLIVMMVLSLSSFGQDKESQVIPTPHQNELTVNFDVNEGVYLFNVYNVSGELIEKEGLIEETSTLSFVEHGFFTYEIVDPKNNQVVSKGLFMN